MSSLDSVIRIWNVDDGSKTSEIKGAPMTAWRIAFKDDSSISSCGEAGKVTTYEVEETEQIGEIKTCDVFSTCISYVTKKFI